MTDLSRKLIAKGNREMIYELKMNVWFGDFF